MDNNKDLEKIWEEFCTLITSHVKGDRATQLIEMYEDMGEKLLLAPASAHVHAHNAFPGGYVDHVMRVANFALDLANTYHELGLQVQDCTNDSVVFCAVNHDLGKLGFPESENPRFVPSNNSWRRENLGEMYQPNKEQPYASVPDLSLFTLQQYSIPMSWTEYLTIKIHDGLYSSSNREYYMAYQEHSKLRSNLPYIIHMADLMASRYEFEQWQLSKDSNKSEKQTTKKPKYGKAGKAHKVAEVIDNSDQDLEIFNQLFG